MTLRLKGTILGKLIALTVGRHGSLFMSTFELQSRGLHNSSSVGSRSLLLIDSKVVASIASKGEPAL